MKAKSNLAAFTLLTLFCTISLSAQNWSEVTRLAASDRAAEDSFGYSVAISGNYAIIGAPLEDEELLNHAGAAYIFERDDSGNWVQVQKITASDRAPSDRFGGSVAISGNYAIIGASFEDDDTALTHAGAAYIFERDVTGNWVEVQKIVASDRDVGAEFGYTVAISGNYAIVGAPFKDEVTDAGNILIEAGAAYIFKRDESGTWTQVQKIIPSHRDSDYRFGYSVSISGDYAIVGAYRDDVDATGTNPLQWAGAAYIFQRNAAGTWTQVQKIVASDREKNDRFGRAVAISGNYAIVGAPRDDDGASGGNSVWKAGSAYIFEKSEAGIWSQVQKIVASDRGELDAFGISVAISGSYAIVGAHYEDEDADGGNTMDKAGSAYIFERNSEGYWSEVRKIVATNRTEYAEFGVSVAIAGDYIIVGAPNENEDIGGGNILSESGAAYIFARSSPTGIANTHIPDADLTLYPNPTNGEVTIDFKKQYPDITITVTDVMGRQISVHNYSTVGQATIDIQGTKGFYLINIATNGEKIARFKVMKY